MAKKKVTVTVVRNYFKSVEVEVEIDENIEDISTELIEGEASKELDQLVENALGDASLQGADDEWSYQSECGVGGSL